MGRLRALYLEPPPAYNPGVVHRFPARRARPIDSLRLPAAQRGSHLAPPARPRAGPAAEPGEPRAGRLRWAACAGVGRLAAQLLLLLLLQQSPGQPPRPAPPFLQARPALMDRTEGAASRGGLRCAPWLSSNVHGRGCRSWSWKAARQQEAVVAAGPPRLLALCATGGASTFLGCHRLDLGGPALLTLGLRKASLPQLQVYVSSGAGEQETRRSHGSVGQTQVTRELTQI